MTTDHVRQRSSLMQIISVARVNLLQLLIHFRPVFFSCDFFCWHVPITFHTNNIHIQYTLQNATRDWRKFEINGVMYEVDQCTTLELIRIDMK